MHNKINSAKINAVVEKMEKMLATNIQTHNRDKFSNADWNQLSKNKKDLNKYMRDSFDGENLSDKEIAEVSRIIREKANNPDEDSIFKVFKNKRWHAKELSTTWTNLTNDLDLAQKQASGKVNQSKVDAVVAKMENILGKDIDTHNRDKFSNADWNKLTRNKESLKEYMKQAFEDENLTGAEIAAVSRTIQRKANDPDKDSMFKVLKNKRHLSGKLSNTYVNLASDLETKREQATSRIIIIPVDDLDNITQQSFKVKAANAGIMDDKEWRSDDQIWLVTRDGDGNVQGKLVEYDPSNPDEFTLVCTLDTDKAHFNQSDLAIAKQVEYQLNSRMQMIQFLPEMSIVTNESDNKQKFFDEIENYKNLRKEPPQTEKFALSAQELSQRDKEMEEVMDAIILKEQTNVDNELLPKYQKDIQELRNENMNAISERVEKSKQVITSLEKEDKDKLSRALDIFKAFDEIEKEPDPDMQTGRLLSLQDFIRKQDPDNYKQSSKNPAENLGNYAAQIITAHNKREIAAKKLDEALQKSHDNDKAPDEPLPYYEDIRKINVEEDKDVNDIFFDDDDSDENEQTPDPDAEKTDKNAFDEEQPLNNVEKTDALKVLERRQENFTLAKETLEELARLNDPQVNINAQEKAERLTAAQVKMANANSDYMIKRDGTMKEQIIHLGKYAMSKLAETKQTLANDYNIKIGPDTTDNQIIKIDEAFDQLINEEEDQLVIGHTPDNIIDQSQLDHHGAVNPAKIFAHPKRDETEVNAQQLNNQQKEAPKIEDDDNDANNFSKSN